MSVEIAAVKPRVILQDTGDCVPLEDVIAALIPDDGIRVIEIVGGPGAGKSTALAHLAAVLAPDARVRLVDRPPEEAWPKPHQGLLVCTSRSRTPDRSVTSLRLAPWGDDDVIEYLLARHSHCCRSVVGRLRAADDGSPLGGVPELWTGVLDEMAADETVTSVRQALKQLLARHCGNESIAYVVRQFSYRILVGGEKSDASVVKNLELLGASPTLTRLLLHDAVKMLLAIDHVVSLLRQRDYELLKRRLPRDVVRQVAAEVRTDTTVIDDLFELTTSREYECQPMAASILHAAGTRWRPDRKRAGMFKSFRLPLLTGAYLEGASWPGIQLSNVVLLRADLSGANLTSATLDRVVMDEACLEGAKLSGASLRKVSSARANLAGAQLVDAFAHRAQLVGANLAGANLAGCMLQRANLRHADLRNANLSRADLFRADLKAAHIDGADFAGAILEDADLSGLKLDDYEDRGFKSPEEIRKANLCGADLRGARIVGVDFYLVDLRRARYTEQQGDHFRRCGAIL